MRIWSLHPQYLDAKGLVALWRETLLAQAVLQGLTRGYTKHPQLIRFQQAADPIGAIGNYLRFVLEESEKRGYHFSVGKIARIDEQSRIPVHRRQLSYEFEHLQLKLAVRDASAWARNKTVRPILPHPIFQVVPGGIEAWEKQPRSSP
ncbi:pyrimidine dimer DNA glycosylase /DNA-(apurinic or apyrimidinic site) lyase [Planctomycetota bacterium]|nr:pyrimidine dimer DNA glycosylase /DNA-(apurinic or apyrimidinic site) lyase [Planctomycetota bacterium]